jgi:hypothetical protein
LLVRWSMASALFLGSWAALMGPMIYGMSARKAASLRNISPTPSFDPSRRSCGCGCSCNPTRQSLVPLLLTTDPSAKHLLSQERLPFTATYFGSIGLTLYFAVGVRCCPPPSHHISLPRTIHPRQSRYYRDSLILQQSQPHAS